MTGSIGTPAIFTVKIPNSLKDIIVALLLFLLTGVAAAWWSGFFPNSVQFPVVIVLQGVLLVGVVGAMLAWRGRSWRNVGLVAPKLHDPVRGVLALGGCLGINVLFVQALYGLFPKIIEAHTEQLGFIAGQLSYGLPFPVLIALLSFVGVYEELFARGLLLGLCRMLLGGAWAPVLVSSLLFGLGHIYQGWLGVAQTTLIGVVLALAVVRWGTLWPAIIAHALLDIVSILLMSGV